jgi:hypothetical protein
VRPGTFDLYRVENGDEIPVDSYSINLFKGRATLNLDASNHANPGEKVTYRSYVTDSTRVADGPFINELVLKIEKPRSSSSRGGGKRKKGRNKNSGNKKGPGGLELPRVWEVYRNPDDNQKGWTEVPGRDFDEESALRAIYAGGGQSNGEPTGEQYDFYVNMNNKYLDNEAKDSDIDPKLLKGRFKYGMVLIGIGLINRSNELENEEDSNEIFSEALDMEEVIYEVTESVAPILLPMIETLGSLEEDPILA